MQVRVQQVQGIGTGTRTGTGTGTRTGTRTGTVTGTGTGTRTGTGAGRRGDCFRTLQLLPTGGKNGTL